MRIDEIKNDMASLLIYRDRRFVLTCFNGTKLGLCPETIGFRLSKLRGICGLKSELTTDDTPVGITACVSFDMSDKDNRDRLIDMVICDHSLLLNVHNAVTASVSEEVRPNG